MEKLPLSKSLYLRSQTIYGSLVETLGHIPEIIRFYIKILFHITIFIIGCQ